MKLKNGKKWVFVLALFAIVTSGKAQVMGGSSPSGKAEIDGNAVQTRRTGILPLLAGAWSGAEVQGKMKTSLDAKKPAVDSPEIGKALLQRAATIDGNVAPLSDGRVPELLLAATTAKGKLNTTFPDSAGAFRIVAPKRGTEQAAPRPQSSGKPAKSASRVLFWSLQGLMIGSTAGAAEATSRCLNAGSCTAIPSPFKSRPALYNVGIPFSVGVAVLSYEMKKYGNHWWFVPPVVTIAADSLLIVHGVRASD